MHRLDGILRLADVIVLDKGEAWGILGHPDVGQLAEAAKFTFNVLLLDAVTDAADEDTILPI